MAKEPSHRVRESGFASDTAALTVTTSTLNNGADLRIFGSDQDQWIGSGSEDLLRHRHELLERPLPHQDPSLPRRALLARVRRVTSSSYFTKTILFTGLAMCSTHGY